MSGEGAHLPRSPLLPPLAAAACGAMWGGLWYPLRWLEQAGIGGAWVSVMVWPAGIQPNHLHSMPKSCGKWHASCTA